MSVRLYKMSWIFELVITLLKPFFFAFYFICFFSFRFYTLPHFFFFILPLSLLRCVQCIVF